METEKKHRLLVISVCLGTALLYFPALFFEYVWDDLIWLDTLRRTEGGIVTLALFKPFLVGDLYWRPLAELTLYIQPGGKPQIFQHGLNILLHLANTVLLFMIADRAVKLGRLERSKWLYFLVLFYALHPAFVEPVAWVSGRFDLLMTTAYLVGMLCLISGAGSVTQIVCVGLCFAVGLLVKESAILFVPLYFGTLWLLNPGTGIVGLIKERKYLWLVLVVLLVAWLIVRSLILGKTGAGFLLTDIASAFMPQKIYMVLSTIGAYAVLLVFPFINLSTLYPLEEMLGVVWYAVVGLALVGVTIWCLTRTSELRKVGVILLLFILSLALFLNVLRLGFADNLIQNRYLYPAFAVLLTAIFVSNLKLPLSRVGERAVSLLAILWLAVAVLNINVTLPLWKDPEKLSRWLYIEHPANPYAANMRASYLLRAGYFEAAIETAGEVAVNRPSYGAYKILGDAHFTLGKCQDAYVYYSYARELGGFPAEKAEGLLGMYRLKRIEDPEEAADLKQQIESLLAGEPKRLAFVLERMTDYETETVECRDEQ